MDTSDIPLESKETVTSDEELGEECIISKDSALLSFALENSAAVEVNTISFEDSSENIDDPSPENIHKIRECFDLTESESLSLLKNPGYVEVEKRSETTLSDSVSKNSKKINVKESASDQISPVINDISTNNSKDITNIKLDAINGKCVIVDSNINSTDKDVDNVISKIEVENSKIEINKGEILDIFPKDQVKLMEFVDKSEVTVEIATSKFTPITVTGNNIDNHLQNLDVESALTNTSIDEATFNVHEGKCENLNESIAQSSFPTVQKSLPCNSLHIFPSEKDLSVLEMNISDVLIEDKLDSNFIIQPSEDVQLPAVTSNNLGRDLPCSASIDSKEVVHEIKLDQLNKDLALTLKSPVKSTEDLTKTETILVDRDLSMSVSAILNRNMNENCFALVENDFPPISFVESECLIDTVSIQRDLSSPPTAPSTLCEPPETSSITACDSASPSCVNSIGTIIEERSTDSGKDFPPIISNNLSKIISDRVSIEEKENAIVFVSSNKNLSEPILAQICSEFPMNKTVISNENLLESNDKLTVSNSVSSNMELPKMNYVQSENDSVSSVSVSLHKNLSEGISIQTDQGLTENKCEIRSDPVNGPNEIMEENLNNASEKISRDISSSSDAVGSVVSFSNDARLSCIFADIIKLSSSVLKNIPSTLNKDSETNVRKTGGEFPKTSISEAPSNALTSLISNYGTGDDSVIEKTIPSDDGSTLESSLPINVNDNPFIDENFMSSAQSCNAKVKDKEFFSQTLLDRENLPINSETYSSVVTDILINVKKITLYLTDPLKQPNRDEKKTSTEKVQKKRILLKHSISTLFTEILLGIKDVERGVDSIPLPPIEKEREWELQSITGVDLPSNKSSYQRVVIAGHAYVKDINVAFLFHPSSEIQPYFLWDESTTSKLEDVYVNIRSHPFLQGTGKILLFLFFGLNNITNFRSWKQCSHSHPSLTLPFIARNQIATSDLLEKMRKVKENFISQKNLVVVFAELPKVLISDSVNNIVAKAHVDYKGCSCQMPISKMKDKFEPQCHNLIDSLNQKMFHEGLTQFEGHKYMPSSNCIVLFNKKVCWGLHNSSENSTNFTSNLLERLHFYCLKNPTNVDFMRRKEIDKESRKVFVIGDSWLKPIAANWPFTCKIKPFFIYEDQMPLDKIRDIIVSIASPNQEACIITSISASDFVFNKHVSGCKRKNHDSLKYPISKNQSELSGTIWPQLANTVKTLAKIRKHCKLLFTTSYPILFEKYYSHLNEMHILNYQCTNQIPQDAYSQNNVCSTAIHDSNEKIKILNDGRNLNTFDVHDIVARHTAIGEICYPTFIEGKSPSPNLIQVLTSRLAEYLLNGIIKHEVKENVRQIPPEDIDKIPPPRADIESKSSEKVQAQERYVSKKLSSVVRNEALQKTKVQDNSKGVYDPKDIKHDIKTGRDGYLQPSPEYSSKPQKLHEMNLKDISLPSGTKPADPHKNKIGLLGTYPYDQINIKSQMSSRQSGGSIQEQMNKRSSRDSKDGHNYYKSRSKERSIDRYRYRRSRERYENRRSRSRERYDNRRSRSRGRFRQRSRSRSRSRYDRRSRSRSYGKYNEKRRERYSKDVITLSSSRSRSRSCTKTRKRSAKSEKKHSKVKRKSKKDTQLEALTSLKEIHLKECNMYRKCPEAHPEYKNLYNKWRNNNAATGYKTTFMKYWNEKVEVLFKEGWEDKKKRCLSLLSNSSTSSSSSSSSESSDSSYEKRKRKKKKLKQEKEEKIMEKKNQIQEKFKPVFIEKKSIAFKIFNPNKDQLHEKDSIMRKSADPKNISSVLRNESAAPYVVPQIKMKLPTGFDVNSGRNIGKINDLIDLLSILTQIGDKFGVLAMSLASLHKTVLDCKSAGNDPLSCIDDDAVMLFTLVNDKVNIMLKNQSLSLVSKVIMQEAQERLLPFLEGYKNAGSAKELDIVLIAQATNGKPVSEIINYIKNEFRDIGHADASHQDIMDTYLKVKNKQVTLTYNEKPRFGHVLHGIPGPSSTPLASPQSFSFHQPPPGYPKYKSHTEDPQNYGYLHTTAHVRQESREEVFKKEFMALTMKERILKFCQFADLPADERDFLMRQLRSIEQTDAQLAKVLHSVMYKN